MSVESNDRSPADYILFALAFLGFMIALSGVILSSTAAAVTGFFVLLFRCCVIG
jgi:hypothetical protein